MFDWRCIYECVNPPVFSILRKAGASPYIQTAVAVAVSNTFYKVCTAVVLLLYICSVDPKNNTRNVFIQQQCHLYAAHNVLHSPPHEYPPVRSSTQK